MRIEFCTPARAADRFDFRLLDAITGHNNISATANGMAIRSHQLAMMLGTIRARIPSFKKA
jgi:hypothetical protein